MRYLILIALFTLLINPKVFSNEIDLVRPELDLSKTLTVPEAISICTSGICPKEAVLVRGMLQGQEESYELSESAEKTFPSVFNNSGKDISKLVPLISDENKVKVPDIRNIEEKNLLQKGGVAEVEIKGILRAREVNMDEPVTEINIITKPSDIKFIRKVK